MPVLTSLVGIPGVGLGLF